MKLHPCGHRVLVRLERVNQDKDDIVEKTASGIIVEVKNERKRVAENFATQEAYVAEIGPTAFKDFGDGKAWCKVGDKVLIVKYSGEDREDPETKDIYRIINDEDIIAIVGE